MSESGCLPITRYALSTTRALGPYGALVYLTLLRIAPGYEVPVATSHAGLVELTGTSYQTLRKCLGVISDLGLATCSGKRVNGRDEAGMTVTLHRRECGEKCGQSCAHQKARVPVDKSAKPVDKPVDNSEADALPDTLLASTVSPTYTALPTLLARATEKPQVKGSTVSPTYTVEPCVGKPTPKNLENLVLELSPKDLAKKKHKAIPRDDRVDEVYDFWLAFEFDGKRLTQHKGMTAQMEKTVTKAIAILDVAHGNGESVLEMQHAIANYGRCLLDDKCGWTYAWTLTDFCGRANGFERFLDEADPIGREMATGQMRTVKERPSQPLAGDSFRSRRAHPFAGC